MTVNNSLSLLTRGLVISFLYTANDLTFPQIIILKAFLSQNYKEFNRDISVCTLIASVKVLIITNVQKINCYKL